MPRGLKLAARWEIPPFIVMEVMKSAAEREAQGRDVLHMEVGQPSTGAPAGVIAAAHEALDRNVLGYTLALGIDPLRQAITDHYRDFQGVAVAKERVAVTTGSSGAFLLTFLASFDPGDKVAILRPGYPCYRHILTVLGIEPVDVPVGPATRFQPTPELLEAAGGPALDGLLLASPANPTGSMLTRDEMALLLDYCRDRTPPRALVEFPDEDQQLVGGRLNPGRQLRYALAQALGVGVYQGAGAPRRRRIHININGGAGRAGRNVPDREGLSRDDRPPERLTEALL